jgi:hypothetical protein
VEGFCEPTSRRGDFKAWRFKTYVRLRKACQMSTEGYESTPGSYEGDSERRRSVSDYFFTQEEEVPRGGFVSLDRPSSLSSVESTVQDAEGNVTEFLGPFILGKVLGSGCSGEVRLGTHKDTGFTGTSVVL